MINDHPLVTRWLLAGPGVLIASLLFTMCMPVWLPSGSAGIDNIVYPLVLAPIFWAIPFTYMCIEDNLVRGGIVLVGVSIVSGIVVGTALIG